MFKIRHAIYWQLAGLAVAVALVSVLSRFFPVVDFVEALQERVMRWGALGAICYPFLFAVCNILLLPGGVLAVGGGFFFGLWWGFLVVFAGNVLAAAISFALTRWTAARWFRRKLSQNPALRALEPAVERESWKIVLLIPFRTYMLWASIGRIPGLFLYAYVGTLGQLGLRVMRGRSQPRIIEYWTWVGAFLTTALLLLVLGRIASRAVKAGYENERRASSENQTSQEKETVEHRCIL